jgi:hypothetical protein
MRRAELLLCLAFLVLGSDCDRRKYQRVQLLNLHLHNNAGEIPIIDLYLSVRVDRVVYVGDCGDVKHLTVPKEWSPGSKIEVSLKKSRFHVRNPKGKDFVCDILTYYRGSVMNAFPIAAFSKRGRPAPSSRVIEP